MALIACSECGKQVSDKAAACPHCGNPIAQGRTEPQHDQRGGVQEIERNMQSYFVSPEDAGVLPIILNSPDPVQAATHDHQTVPTQELINKWKALQFIGVLVSASGFAIWWFLHFSTASVWLILGGCVLYFIGRIAAGPSMTSCKDCGISISRSAEACPRCGAKRPKPTSLTTWFFSGIFLLVLYQCMANTEKIADRAQERAAQTAAMTPAEKAAVADRALASDAKWQCREFVERGLRAPSTAKFPDYNEFSAVSSGDGFVVTGYVDAQNSFGAMLRTQFTCRVRKSGETWQLINLATKP